MSGRNQPRRYNAGHQGDDGNQYLGLTEPSEPGAVRARRPIPEKILPELPPERRDPARAAAK